MSRPRTGDLICRRRGMTMVMYACLEETSSVVVSDAQDDVLALVLGTAPERSFFFDYIYVITLGPHPHMGWVNMYVYEPAP